MEDVCKKRGLVRASGMVGKDGKEATTEVRPPLQIQSRGLERGDKGTQGCKGGCDHAKVGISSRIRVWSLRQRNLAVNARTRCASEEGTDHMSPGRRKFSSNGPVQVTLIASVRNERK